MIAAATGTVWPEARPDLMPTDFGIDVGVPLHAQRHIVGLNDLFGGEGFELKRVRQPFRQQLAQRPEAA